MEDEDLKPCPFCGCTELRIDKCTSTIRCTNCMAKNPSITRFIKQGLDEEEALFCSWNERWMDNEDNK